LDFRYIAIEGPVGVGKSQLADRLGARMDATVVLDETDNPFLGEFYSGRPGSAFQTQLFFTLGRHRQQTALRQSDLFSQLTVCDYLFDRDKIYAYLNLDDNELFIYQRLYELLTPDLRPPDLVIYLQTPTELLRKRLRDRARTQPDAPVPDDEYGHAAPRHRDVAARSLVGRRDADGAGTSDSLDGERDAVLRTAGVICD